MARHEKQPGLEVALSDGPIASPMQSPKTSAITNTRYSDLEAAEAKNSRQQDRVSASESRYICGLRTTTFWLLIVLLVVILAAGIGGGVGGALAHNQSHNSAKEHTRYGRTSLGSLWKFAWLRMSNTVYQRNTQPPPYLRRP